jgi:hypothetical protein
MCPAQQMRDVVEMMMERGEILTVDQEGPMFELRWDQDPWQRLSNLPLIRVSALGTLYYHGG